MLTMARIAILGIVAGGIMSLFSGFSFFGDGFQRPPAPPTVVHTTVVTERVPTAHWPKGAPAHGRGHHHQIHIRIP